MKKAPIVIINDPPIAQINIESTQLITQFINTTNVQIDIKSQNLYAITQSPILNIDFSNPIINNNICTKLAVIPQSQIIRGEPYKESYIITPSQKTQVLHTKNKYLTEDIVINPIVIND